MKTLDTLPGEGEEKIITIKKTRCRHECHYCGEPAHFKHTYLLIGGRRNPASSAYGKDDCTWCADDSNFACKEHEKERSAAEGYSWCATFSATERFAHMFLYWHEEEIKP